MAARVALVVGRYRDAVAHADEGYRIAIAAIPVLALDCLDWRALARCWLGEWDEFFADAALAEDVLGDRRESPPGFASDHLGARAFIHEVRGEEGEADHVLQLLAWLDKVEERPSARTVWTAQLYARRKQFELARDHLERPELNALVAERHALLQAWCELVAEEGAWDRARPTTEEARAHARASGTAALLLFADRLEGRAALAGGDHDQATAVLGRAASGFRGLEAAWEAAVTEADLAEALVRAGKKEEAHQQLRNALPVLERLNSVRELASARAVLDQVT